MNSRISEQLNRELNLQINKEFYSGYLYLAMSDYFNKEHLYGFAHWCKKQSEEELSHGMDIFEFLDDLNGHVEFMQISQPQTNFQSPLETVKAIAIHEEHITQSLKQIAIMAKEENTFAIISFLKDMLNEQHEEEKSAFKIYSKYKMFGENKAALYLLDKELGER